MCFCPIYEIFVYPEKDHKNFILSILEIVQF